jgi:hypothetical protein
MTLLLKSPSQALCMMDNGQSTNTRLTLPMLIK